MQVNNPNYNTEVLLMQFWLPASSGAFHTCMLFGKIDSDVSIICGPSGRGQLPYENKARSQLVQV